MKKKSLILLPLLVLGSTGLSMLVTSCDKPVKSIAFEDTADITVKIGKTALVPNVTVLPEKATDKSYTVVSSASTIADVSYEEAEGAWVIKGVAPGEATITAISKSNKELKTTLKVTVPQPRAIPTPVAKTVTELLGLGAERVNEELYVVEGYVTSVYGGKYGNLTLADATDLSKEITVYGSTDKASSIAWNDSETVLNFNNPQNYESDKLSTKYSVGDKVKLVGIYNPFKETPQIQGYVLLDEVVKAETDKTRKITLNVTGGTAEWVELQDNVLTPVETDITKLYWGQKLLLKVTPTEPKETATVKVNGNKVSPLENGAYEIVVTPNAIVDVTFDKAVTGLYELVPSVLSLTGSYGTVESTVEGLAITSTQTMKTSKNYKAEKTDVIQMKGKDGKFSAIHNTAATSGNITSVKVVYADNEHTTLTVEVIASKAPITIDANGVITLPEDTTSYEVKSLANKAGTEQEITVTFDAASEFTYFMIRHNDTNTYAAYVVSATVTTDAYVAPEAK